MAKEYYSISEAYIYSRLPSPWMVDYLCRAGIVQPKKRLKVSKGSPRLFSFADLVMLRAISDLLAKGISVKRLASEFRRHHADFEQISENVNPFRFLATDGEHLFLDSLEEGVERLSKPGQYCFRFLIDMHNAHRDVCETIAQDPEIPTVLSLRQARMTRARA